MEKVGMGINETNHELIIIEAGCEDIWTFIIFFILMYIFDIFCNKNVIKYNRDFIGFS